MEWYDLSPERQIRWSLGPDPAARWGWVMYRTTYLPVLNGVWDTFKRQIVERMRAEIAASDAPEIAGQMDFVFVEDPALEGASRQELKRRFRTWAVKDGADPDLGETDSRDTRHAFFLQVDAECLTNARIIIVRGWQETTEGQLDEDGYPQVPEDWFKMMNHMVEPWFYADLFDSTESWFAYYRPPPDGVCIS